ncbi:RagB/SusD family nutrient uptake outer membrane protein [Capnocytophaga cynodegmi]|uniref:RagB/SusD family nutrient uptake outer membrane protein n=1 Tax=Capnocytophaga cynodegmi TaxID=28189 RepID=UPI0037D2A850
MKVFKKIIIVFVAIAFLAGCKKDFLETEPSNQIGQKQAEGTAQGLNGILNGIHSMMYNYAFGQGFGYGHSSLSAQLDFLGDDVINTLSGYYMGVYRYTSHMTVSSDSGINFKAWDYYYTVIQHANKLINGAELTKLTPSERHTLLGEGYAFRAWAYHNLVQLFGKRYEKGSPNTQLGVIIRTASNLDEHLPRSTVGEVYNFIDSDIAKSLEHLKQAPDKKRKNAISYATACGIAARIALTKSDWENAEKYAQLSMDNFSGSLQSGNSLVNGFNDIRASEWMWAYTQNAEQNYAYAHFNAHYSYNFYNGWNDGLRIAVNRDIYDLMGENDVRRKWWVCLDRGDEIPSDADPTYFIGGTKNPRWETTGQSIKFKAKSTTDSRGDLVTMRLAEIYYILAEAQARQNKGAEARATLNKVMVTRDVDYSTTATGTALIDEIMRNKRIDLWLEGQRFFDMKRLGVVSDRLNSKNIQHYLTGTNKQTAITRNSGTTVINVPTSIDSKFWQFAIPYGEIKGNPLCQQNEL